MSLHMQPAWVRHVTLMRYDTTKRGTHRTRKSQLHADTANQDRPTGLILQRLPHVICHHLIVQPSWCAVPHTAGKEIFEVGCGVRNSEVRVRTISICHGYYVMGIRSCELSEPRLKIGSVLEIAADSTTTWKCEGYT